MRAFQLKAQRNITIVDLDDDNEDTENNKSTEGEKKKMTDAAEEKSGDTAATTTTKSPKKPTDETEKMSVDTTVEDNNDKSNAAAVEKKTLEKTNKSDKDNAEDDIEMEDDSKAKTKDNEQTAADTTTTTTEEEKYNKGNDGEATMIVEDKPSLCDEKNIKLPEPTLFELLNWLDNPPEDITFVSEFCITLDDFCEAVKVVQPSAKREGFITVPDVTWDDVGSLQDIREELKLAVLAPVKFPEKMARLGLSAPSGVLLCGPPGCGKTLLAKAIANEAGINFISVKGPELMNMV